MIIWVLVAAAAVLLLWPSTSLDRKPSVPLPPAVEPKRSRPSYIDSVQALQCVRTRLADTEQLGDAQHEACNVLTLALSAGSEK